jgi:phosphoribosylamine--glycine ligase
VEWAKEAAVCVVMAAGGYPKAYNKGDAITGLDDAKAAGCQVFHAGTAHKNGQIVTDGGRVLGVVAKAADVRAAVDKAYAGVEKIAFKDAFYRKDIAHRALER